MAPALQQRPVQPQDRRHQPARSRRLRRRTRVDSGTAGDPNKFRGMMGTKGQFAINPRWDFGWDVLAQTDKNFSHTYDIDGYSRLRPPIRGLPDRPQRPQLFRPARHAVRGPGRRARQLIPRAQRQAALGAAVARLRLHSRRAGGRRPAVTSTSTRASSAATSSIRRSTSTTCRLRPARPRHRGRIRPPDRRGRVEADLHHRWRPGDHAAARLPGRRQLRQRVVGFARRHQSDGDNPLIDAAPTCARRFARYMATAGLEMRWPVLFSIGQFQPCPRADGAGLRAPERAICRRPRHPQRGRAELRLRCDDAVRARQVLRLRPHRRRHARQCRPALFRRLRQWLDHQRAVRPVLPARPATIPSPRPTWSMSAPIRASKPTRPTMSAWSASPARTASRPRSAAGSTNRRFEVRRAEAEGRPIPACRFR